MLSRNAIVYFGLGLGLGACGTGEGSSEPIALATAYDEYALAACECEFPIISTLPLFPEAIYNSADDCRRELPSTADERDCIVAAVEGSSADTVACRAEEISRASDCLSAAGCGGDDRMDCFSPLLNSECGHVPDFIACLK